MGIVAVCTFVALHPPRRPRRLADVGFRLGLAINELPFIAFYALLASTLLAFGQGDIATAGGWLTFGLAALTTCGLAVIAWRGAGTGSAVDRALDKSPEQNGSPISSRRLVHAIARRRKVLVAELRGPSGNAASVRATRREPGAHIAYGPRASATSWTFTARARARRPAPR